MIQDKQRIQKALTDGTADCIIKENNNYYLLKGNNKIYIHTSTFQNARTILQEVSRNMWKLK